MLNFEILLLSLLLTLIGTNSHSASGPHIADVNILLPPKMTNPVEYRLQGSDGCFKWSWDHHDILSVLPEYNVSSHCSTSARLRSIAPYSGRKETAVYAADVQTGIVIRCKVFIENFSRIQIFHNSIKLDLDGLATLRVRAFDSEENVFSSLVGLQFMWHLTPQTDGSSHHLAHLPLKDSPLGDCGGLCGDLDIQIKLEDSGVFSDLFVVRGIEIGQEVVSLHMLEPELQHMTDKIVLTVAEAMSLDPPSPVFVLVGATVCYSLKVIRANIPQVVTLPTPHYRWSTSNSSIAHIDSRLGSTNAVRLGATAVTVEDTRVAGHIQISSLNVVMPDSLHLYINPLPNANEPLGGVDITTSASNWYIVIGRQYLVRMKIFSRGSDAQEIYITESDDVKLHDNQTEYMRTYFVPNDIVPKRELRTSRILQATSKGKGKLTASLTYYGSTYETKEVLKITQVVVICEQVRFSLDDRSGLSRSIFLPWIPSVYQEALLKATGGCAETSSDYKWFSSDMSVVTVSASGVVQAKEAGKATVKVQSVFDPSNYDEVIIEVALPASMMILSFPVETVVGSYLEASVTMQSSNGVYFYRCDAFNSHVKWKIMSESFKIENKTREIPALDMLENVELHGSSYGPPCSWTSVYASGSGHTMLQATLYKEYHHFDLSSYGRGPIVLKASSRIGAYPPLLVRHLGDGSQFGGYWVDLAQAEADNFESLDKLFIVPGAHFNVMLHGGPEQWGKGVEFIETVEVLGEEPGFGKGRILVHQVSENYGSSYQILCQTLGTYNLHFKRGNLVGDNHPMPAIAEVLLSVMCRIPSSIVLVADQPVNKVDVIQSAFQADRSLKRIRVTPVTVANSRTIRIAAVGISASGEPFANSSSLYLMWELSSCGSLAHWDKLYGSQIYGWERFLSLQNESGECIVRATVIDFGDVVSKDNSAQLFESSDNILTDAIRLQLVSTLRVDPQYNLLFFNPDLKVNLSITGGSCFLEAVVNDSRIVDVIQPAPGIQYQELVLSPKGLGTALVTVYDIGLNPPQAASAVVHVADVDWIKISSQEEISLVKESSLVVDIAAGINDGSTFASSQFAYMHILVHIEHPIVELVDTDDLTSTGHGMLRTSSFKIRAVALGITTLSVSFLQQSGREILSEPIKIEVYPPPRVHPQDIFLFPGASYTITVKGGPTVGTYVEYASMDDAIVNIHKSSGQLSAVSSGKCNISATFYHYGGNVICQAYGNIKVGVPSTVVLNIQNEQLGVGKEMPIYPMFPEGDVFSFYELCKSYRWTVEDEKVLSFSSLEHSNGRKYRYASTALEDVEFMSYMHEKELGFINTVHGRSAGITNVTVSFSCEFTSGSNIQTKLYKASASLSVVPNFPLALGVPITWILPPYYTTSKVLPSSMDSYGHSESQSRKRTITYSLLRSCGEKNEDVWKEDAISIQGDRIKTSESNNLACIQAKDRSSGRIEIAACVRVAEVAQIRITNQEFPFHVINLVVGAELSLPISYHDSLGNLFHEAHDVVLFYVETNYPDVVSINYSREGNGCIYLKAKQHGRALVQVSIDKNPESSDYILVSVGALIHPQDPVIHVGNHLNFSIKGNNDQISGRWITTNKSVLSLNMLSGRAEAVGPGSTEVFFEGSNINLRTMVHVETGHIVSVAAPAEILTNVPFPAKGYNFSVNFSNKYGTLLKDESVLLEHDCRVDPPFVGYAKPWLDLDHNNSYCLFFPYSPEHLARSVPKSKTMRPDISVTIYASSREASQFSASASALFVGGFSVLEMGKSTTQLNLTPDSNKTVITILGNTDVEIHCHERDLVIFGPISKEESGIGGRAEYQVRAVGTKRFKSRIIITLAANGQRTEIYVFYEPGEREASETIFTLNLFAIIISCLLLLILTVSFIICYLDKPTNRTQSSQSPNTRTPIGLTGTAPATPDRSSPAISLEQSPRTPQPFVDYVRQTIDETPYYRREGRRRFNVQNTL